MKSYLEQHFDYDCNQCSPVRLDYERTVSYDSDGNEFVSWLPVDYSLLRQRNGSVVDWSLENLLKAGVNPDFPIKTGLNTRLEGVCFIEQASAVADSILNDTN